MADVTIIGGGIIGLCSALALQDKGFSVELIERGRIGMGASYGNCGLLAPGEVVPVSRPGVIRKIPRWLLDPEGPLFVRPAGLARDLGWLLKFIRAGRVDRVRHIAASLSPLMERVNHDYRALLETIGRPDLLSTCENLMLFNDREEYIRDRFSWDLRGELGFGHEFITRDDIRALEPAIDGPVTCGVIMRDWYHFTDPFEMTTAFAAEFERRGGQVHRANVTALDIRDNRVSAAIFDDGTRLGVRNLVLAAGAWSGPIAKQLGLRIPLAHLSGYHLQAPDPQIRIERAIYYASGGLVLTPMSQGLRIGGTIEIAGPDPKPNYRRADVLGERAKSILPGLSLAGSTRWMGPRPFITDTLPVLGKASSQDNVVLAFGHGQIGMTLGATTGKLVAELVNDEKPTVDIFPLRAQRFR